MPEARSAARTAAAGSARCLRLVREAERLAEAQPVEAVVFTGWSRERPLRGRADARLGRPRHRARRRADRLGDRAERRPHGPAVARAGIARAVVVCAPLHVYRTRFLLAALRAAQDAFHVARFVPRPRALAWELVALPVLRRQLGGEAELRALQSRDVVIS